MPDGRGHSIFLNLRREKGGEKGDGPTSDAPIQSYRMKTIPFSLDVTGDDPAYSENGPSR